MTRAENGLIATIGLREQLRLSALVAQLSTLNTPSRNFRQSSSLFLGTRNSELRISCLSTQHSALNLETFGKNTGEAERPNTLRDRRGGATAGPSRAETRNQPLPA